MLHGNLCPGLLVRPVQVQRLEICREAPSDCVPIYRAEGAFPSSGEVHDAIMDEVDLAIDIARSEAREITDLGDRHSVRDHPQNFAVRAAAVLLPDA